MTRTPVDTQWPVFFVLPIWVRLVDELVSHCRYVCFIVVVGGGDDDSHVWSPNTSDKPAQMCQL